MTRFGVMKHLTLLEESGLVVPSRQGRQKLHHLNVAPIRLVHDRWISKFVTRRDDGENLIGLHSILLARSLAGSPNPPGACRGSGLKSARMSIEYQWRGDIENDEVNALHAEAFETRLLVDEWDWQSIVRQSLGWVVARDDGRLVGFVNVIWDGSVHAWIQDTMVASGSRRKGIGTHLVQVAREQAGNAGCEWLHVDFEDDLGSFYYEACGFEPTSAGLIHCHPATS